MNATPTAIAMLRACEDALHHCRRYQSADAMIRMLVDDLPQGAPDKAGSGEWYRVGVLHLVTFDHTLAVYLDAVTGRVQVEQPLMQVARRPSLTVEPVRPKQGRDALEGECDAT